MAATQPYNRPVVHRVLAGCALLALWAAGSYFLHFGGGATVKTDQGQKSLVARSNSTMAFEVNQGQTDPEAKYLARGPGYTLFLTSTGAVWSLRPQLSASETGRTTAMLRMQISGADSYPGIAAAETLPGISNYYIGMDPSKWQTQVAHYARVSYENLYPGVNLSWHGEQRQLDFDF